MSDDVGARQTIALNSTVRIGLDQSLRGQVIAICIRATGVTYEVVWWKESQRYCQWLSAAEVVLEEGQEMMDVGHYL